MRRDAINKRRARLGLVGLAALFLLPLAASFYLYYGTAWRPSGGTQHGQLITPARQLPQVTLHTVDGAETPAGFLQGSWHLVYVDAGPCEEPCRDTLLMTRQLRLALDRDMNRVHRVFLYSTAPPRAYLDAEHGDLLAADIAGSEGTRLLDAFPQDPPPLAQRRLSLVDPLGNLMMSYPADTPPRPLLTDLERLLKLSHIG
jgi:hypothetical protein